MSIITEALKKLQAERTGPVKPQNNAAGTAAKTFTGEFTPEIITKKPPAVRNAFFFAVPAAVVIIGIIFAGWILTSKTFKRTPGVSPVGLPGKLTAAADKLTSAGHPDENIDGVDGFTLRANTQNISEQASSLRSKPADAAAVSSKTPVLSGIMYSPTNPQAIVNGKMVKEGDMINGFLIKKIDPNSVSVVSEGKETELKL